MMYIPKYIYDDRTRSYIRIPSMKCRQWPTPRCRPIPHLHSHCYSPVDPHVGLCPMATLGRGAPRPRSAPWIFTLEYPSAARKRGSRHHPIDDLRRRSWCMKNVALLVPGYVVTKLVSVERSCLSSYQSPSTQYFEHA